MENSAHNQSNVFSKFKEIYGDDLKELFVEKMDESTGQLDYIVTITEEKIEFLKETEFSKMRFEFIFSTGKIQTKNKVLSIPEQEARMRILDTVFKDIRRNQNILISYRLHS